jgi:hypothetical protein|tara:strand:- start:2287 stop:2487 length:201 start_codon:yes stop_codon:yes gene_type:complete
MPIKSATIDLANVSEEDTKSETELRKQAFSQILKDARLVGKVLSRLLIGFVFVYGLVSILQDVNLI